jgi:predicted  nucleic acid-binding Zn-ribbon protein
MSLIKGNRKLKYRAIIVVLVLLLAVIGADCTPRNDVNSRINVIVKTERFSIAGWEFSTLIGELKQPKSKATSDEDKINTVKQYFEITKQLNALKAAQKTDSSLQAQKDALESNVEKIIEQQIKDVLGQNGIYNPFLSLKIGFPPVNFKLSIPPQLLVVSPRDKIERSKEVMLLPDLSLDKAEALETQVGDLGVSALVVPLGGLGATFPTFVDNGADLRFTIDAAAEEWLHQYLAFKPLGFNYVLDLLGIARNYDVATINETVASMVSKEIGAQVYDKYYASDEPATQPAPTTKPTFDFNAAMREIRKTVDSYLANGEITTAEQYMEQQRRYLATNSYYIRKLNQAYFAFYGSYADSPTSISPIGTKLQKLRSRSASLKEFLSTVANVNSVQDLDKILTAKNTETVGF